jgi:hypothetical protein
MKRALFQAAVAIFLIGAWVSPSRAQQRQETTQEPAEQQDAAADSTERTRADETFELNITEKRITERDFAASTSVEAGEESARGLRLRVGVELGASEIDVLLRNVRGSVRFRATLERVLDRINARRPSFAAP